jgi:hypothetical protein
MLSLGEETFITATDTIRKFPATDKKRNNRRLSQPLETGLTNADESYQRMGGLLVIPGLLREVGGDPIVILPRAGLETSALDRGKPDSLCVDGPFVSQGRFE